MVPLRNLQTAASPLLPAFTWGNGEKQLQPAHRRNFSGNDDALADGCVGLQVAVTQFVFRLRLRQLGQPLVERLLRKAAFHPGRRVLFRRSTLVLAIALAIAARSEQSYQQY